MKIIDQEIVWDGFIRLTRQLVRLDDGLEVWREVHDHGNAVAVLPIDLARRKIVLVRQRRVALALNQDPERRLEAPLLEVIAGMLEKGEDPAACARREALEETGYEITGLEKIAGFYTSPATMTQYMHLFAARYDSQNQSQPGGGLEEEGEQIEVVQLSLDEAHKMLVAGEFVDAKTLIALQWLFAQRGMK